MSGIDHKSSSIELYSYLSAFSGIDFKTLEQGVALTEFFSEVQNLDDLLDKNPDAEVIELAIKVETCAVIIIDGLLDGTIKCRGKGALKPW